MRASPDRFRLRKPDEAARFGYSAAPLDAWLKTFQTVSELSFPEALRGMGMKRGPKRGCSFLAPSRRETSEDRAQAVASTPRPRSGVVRRLSEHEPRPAKVCDAGLHPYLGGIGTAHLELPTPQLRVGRGADRELHCVPAGKNTLPHVPVVLFAVNVQSIPAGWEVTRLRQFFRT